MNTTRTISRYYAPFFTWGFRRFVFTATGRTLTQHALSLIEHLERQRLRLGYIRATIDSADYSYDEIAEPLQLYVRYIRDHYPETAIVNATKRLADRFGRGINPSRRYSTTDTFVMGTRFRYALRGHTPDILLMFDVDRFPRDSFSVIFRTAISAIELYRGTVIIVHGDFTPQAACHMHLCNTTALSRCPTRSHVACRPTRILDSHHRPTADTIVWLGEPKLAETPVSERSELAGVQPETPTAARRVAIKPPRPKPNVQSPAPKVLPSLSHLSGRCRRPTPHRLRAYSTKKFYSESLRIFEINCLHRGGSDAGIVTDECKQVSQKGAKNKKPQELTKP